MCDPIKKARRKTGFFEWQTEQTAKCFPTVLVLGQWIEYNDTLKILKALFA